MALAPGTRLGPYEVIAPIGAGGMGEVYSARDTRLDRTVALKILPPHLADAPEVRQRFEREARAVSSLNHPNICALYDIGRQDSTDYLVMEYLEGQTLAKRIEQGPMPTPELLRVAIQICEALERAHRQGLIHRDLKPGNVMLTKGGAKLLDFGLAKGAAPAVTDMSSSPTMTQPMVGSSRGNQLTVQGTIVGTLQYMSPEQLEGGEADARSDIFSFGATLYEMATGQKAFPAKSQATLIAAIIKEEPRPISELQPMSLPALERIVTTCLSKDPDDRWQSAGDLKRELIWISSAGSQTGVPAPVVAQRKSRELTWKILLAVLGLVAAAGIAGSLFYARKASQPLPVIHAEMLPPEGYEFGTIGKDNQFALSPEDEARSVARRAAADGRLHGVVIAPIGELGNRITAAFADELSHLGGSVLDSQRYENSQVDFSDAIKQVLQVHVVKGEPSTHRTDAAFVFVVGSAGVARQILPQLKFHYAGDVPVYSTSDSFEPDSNANSDLDGMLFPDMPWMVADDPVTIQIRDAVRAAWPARTARRDRLYAFGFDAYRLVPALRSKSPAQASEISGVTGKLHLDEHNRIHRDLEWAQIRNGVPFGL